MGVSGEWLGPSGGSRGRHVPCRVGLPAAAVSSKQPLHAGMRSTVTADPETAWERPRLKPNACRNAATSDLEYGTGYLDVIISLNVIN